MLVRGWFYERSGMILREASRAYVLCPPQAGACPCARRIRALYLAYSAKQAR
jgi:hypothetical protein